MDKNNKPRLLGYIWDLATNTIEPVYETKRATIWTTCLTITLAIIALIITFIIAFYPFL